MASKFALFYRFADFYKRKDVIDQFPVFAGMIRQEYYSDLIELNNLKSQLKRKQKTQRANEKGTVYVKENLQPLLQDYYALLDTPFSTDITAQKMLNIASDLPEFNDSLLFDEGGIVERYHTLNEALNSLRDEEREILIKIDNISGANQNGTKFVDMLNELKEQTEISTHENLEYICPICGNNCEDISSENAEITKSTEWLDAELQITNKYTADFSEDVRKLKELHSQIECQIKDVWKQIKNIDQKFIKSKELVSKREKVNYAKARIALYAEISNSGLYESVDEDIENIKSQIRLLEEKIQGFDLDNKKYKAQVFLSENMNRLSRTLDFEEEYRPINLNFGLIDETFDIYQHQNQREKIYLYEMGSGANWVSCHIALFLSFLRYFTAQENSPMPLTMFFDQPSQAYFPQGESDANGIKLSSADLKAVNQMYKTIFNEINAIGKDTGILPQILIVDHVDGNDLEVKNEFVSYVRGIWRNGSALI